MPLRTSSVMRTLPLFRYPSFDKMQQLALPEERPLNLVQRVTRKLSWFGNTSGVKLVGSLLRFIYQLLRLLITSIKLSFNFVFNSIEKPVRFLADSIADTMHKIDY